MSATTIPVDVSSEAAARVAELGMQREFEQMLEHTRQTVSGLRGIYVRVEYHDPCLKDDPRVVLWTHRDIPDVPDDPTDRDWSAWVVTQFPPDVFIHFSMSSVDEAPPDGR